MLSNISQKQFNIASSFRHIKYVSNSVRSYHLTRPSTSTRFILKQNYLPVVSTRTTAKLYKTTTSYLPIITKRLYNGKNKIKEYGYIYTYVFISFYHYYKYLTRW